MKMISTTAKNRFKRLARIAPLLALTLTLGTMAAIPANAAWNNRGGWQREGWNAHARGAASWHRAHPVYAPGYVYAPPPVVYYPPPSPGINLILPLNIR